MGRDERPARERDKRPNRTNLSVIGRAVDLRGEALVLAPREVVALEDGLLPEHGAAPGADDLLGGGRRPHVLHLAGVHPCRASRGLPQPAAPLSIPRGVRAAPQVASRVRRRHRRGAGAGRRGGGAEVVEEDDGVGRGRRREGQ